MSEQPAATTPVTGHGEVDAALARLADLDQVPLDQHHDRLTSAHAALHEALHGAEEDPGPGRPAVPRPPG